MALITRVSRLFQADFHAVLDRIEEPEAILRQAVREMEEELARDEQRSTMLQQEQRQLLSRETGIEQSLQDIEEELGACFAAGNDDLARACIRRRLEARRLARNLSRKRGEIGEMLDALRTRIRENRSRRRPNCWPAKASAPGPLRTGTPRRSPSATRRWKWPFCAKNSTGAGYETAHIP